MTSHLDSHTATDVKPDMLSGVQTGNGIPHDQYNICGIAHVKYLMLNIKLGFVLFLIRLDGLRSSI